MNRADRLSYGSERTSLQLALLARLHGDPAADLHPVSVIERNVAAEHWESARAQRVAALAEADFLMGVRLPLWERSTPLTKSVYATHILMGEGNAHYLVLRLGRERLRIGIGSAGGLKAHCRREIQRRLLFALGRPVDFCFTLEGASRSPDQPKVRDHLNIIMAVDDQELWRVRRALVDFSTYHYRPRALNAKRVYHGFWLAFYGTKEFVETQALHDLNQFAITRELSRRARALYEADRDDVRAAQALRRRAQEAASACGPF